MVRSDRCFSFRNEQKKTQLYHHLRILNTGEIYVDVCGFLTEE